MNVIISTSGRASLLKSTLISIKSCKKPSTFESVIIVENGTTNPKFNSINKLSNFSNIKYIHTPSKGKTKALNIALNYVDTGLVVFFDDDVYVHPKTLICYAEAAQREGPDAFFGGPQDVNYEVPPPAWLKPFLPSSARGWGLEGIEKEKNHWFIGTNWAAYAKSLKGVGGFNEEIGPGSPSNSLGDETEIQEKLTSAGLRQVFVPGAKVWHYVPKTRCTPFWMLRRGYRMGVTIGVASGITNRTLFGIPRWWFPALLRAFSKLFVEVVRGSKADRFEAVLRVCRHVGIFSGYKHSN
jgi:GT2 family glycosyltransferase